MLEPDGGNLYRPHRLQVHSGQFWRCAHGLTGFVSGFEWGGCEDCAKADPEAFREFNHRSQLKALRAHEHNHHQQYPVGVRTGGEA